ncbi:ArsR/SmtB family transcription factor [Alkalihalobacillus trypoxylicola]|uniref:ArsR/SmtB family transcription factor n=1 Tax=Alkalihalobacillus trypoxylicola TaxID=519424 RepID=UPI000A4EFE41|nr:metalloregulator ArsR/SmtB family transcription factor [Alkalihalobacillus trypoxylicola]
MNKKLSLVELSSYLKVVSDPTRFLIIKLLERRTYCVCEFVEMLGISQPAVSQHLRRLKDSGLVLEEKREQWRYFSINQTSPFYSIIEELLKRSDNGDERFKQAIDKEGLAQC